MATTISRGLPLIALALALAGAARADDPPALARKELDRRLSDALRDVINTGAGIFNAGDEEGCYRLYEGALTTALPLLDHRVELKKAAEQKMVAARRVSDPGDRAFALRAVIDDIRTAIKKDLAPAAPAPKASGPATLAPMGGGNPLPPVPQTLWQRLGGEKGVRAVVKDFVQTAAANPKVNFNRNGKYKLDAAAVAALEQKLVEWISDYGAGNLKYTGRDMKTAHAGMAITDAEFAAAAADLVAALKKHNVAQKDIDSLMLAVTATKRLIVEPKPMEKK